MVLLLPNLLFIWVFLFFSKTSQKTIYLDSSTVSSNGDGLNPTSPKKYLDDALSINELDLEVNILTTNEPYRITKIYSNLKNIKIIKTSAKKPTIIIQPNAGLTLSGSLLVRDIIFTSTENSIAKKLTNNIISLNQVGQTNDLTIEVKFTNYK